MSGRTDIARVFCLALLLGLVTLVVAAQSLAVASVADQPPSIPYSDDARPGWRPGTSANAVPSSATAPAIDLGQPGLSFRYDATFGQPQVAYLDEPQYLNGPRGVGTDGTDIWIAECQGRRALKYAADGTFEVQIGQAGFRYGLGIVRDCLSDVAVDGDGNTWVVDKGAHHVVKFNPGGERLAELGTPWNVGPGNDQFDEPLGITFDPAGNIYVSDKDNHRIQVFDPNAVYLTTIGVTGVPGSDNGHFARPGRVAVDDDDRLYVADSANHRLQILDVSNPLAPVYLATIGVTDEAGSDNGHFNWPVGVALDEARGRIYVADAENWRVQVFDLATHAYQATLSGFRYLSDVAVDSAGNLVVADWWNHRVQRFDPNLVYLRTYGTVGVPYRTQASHYHQPAAVAVAPDGSLYIGESRGRRLIKLNDQGEPVWVVGEPGVWHEDTQGFSTVEDVALDAAGRVYAADASNHRVQVYSPGGAYLSTLGTGYGTGNNQFNRPMGVAVGPDKIYVADTNNHRVQILDHNLIYLATLGETGVAGMDNGHFSFPRDVDVDAAGNIYVADQLNHRIQVFDSNRAHVRTIGESGVPGQDLGHLAYPTAVTVDGQGRTFVADDWGQRVQVFDHEGAFLTSLGGGWEGSTEGLGDVEGLAVDLTGKLYAAERENHTVQVFAPGVPGWVQVNINGFGDLYNVRLSALAGFAGHLYAGTSNSDGAELVRLDDQWSAVVAPGFGIAQNTGIGALLAANGLLIAGTRNGELGAEVWTSPNGVDWTQVISRGFGSPGTNQEVTSLQMFDGQVYAATGSWDSDAGQGAEIWRSADGLSWTRVVTEGFGRPDNLLIGALAEADGYLYASTRNQETGGELWRTNTGDPGSWTWANAVGLDAGNDLLSGVTAFGGNLYMGTRNTATGAELWRSSDGTDWQKVLGDGLGQGPAHGWLDSLVVFEGRLYAMLRNDAAGVQVWRTANGTDWAQFGVDGFGDSYNGRSDEGLTASAIFGDRLYVGTFNSARGGQLWKKTLTAGMVATPTHGHASLQVAFQNTSSGDYVTSLWDFGDGDTSTESNPVHTYGLGIYDVTLTVGDGIDTSTITRPAYIHVTLLVHLPVVFRHD